MDLKEYKDKSGVSFSFIAKTVGCSITMISCINRGLRPSKPLARKIEQATGGHVPATNWYPMEDEVKDTNSTHKSKIEVTEN